MIRFNKKRVTEIVRVQGQMELVSRPHGALAAARQDRLRDLGSTLSVALLNKYSNM